MQGQHVCRSSVGQEIALDTLKDAISGALHSLVLLQHSRCAAASLKCLGRSPGTIRHITALLLQFRMLCGSVVIMLFLCTCNHAPD